MSIFNNICHLYVFNVRLFLCLLLNEKVKLLSSKYKLRHFAPESDTNILEYKSAIYGLI